MFRDFHKLKPEERRAKFVDMARQNEAAFADVLEKERTVLEELTRNEGKPEQALPKIVEGRLNGFYKNTVLVEQPFVRDPKTTVGKLVGELGKDATIRRFVRIQVGAE